MNNKLEIFKNEEFGEIRSIKIEDEIYFVGKEIANILGYQNGSRDINRHVEKEDRKIISINDGIQNRDAIVINESGLYSLILSSKQPKAKKFKHWVTNEVLPTIRRTGGYVSNEDLFINTYLPYADGPTKRLFSATLEVVQSQNRMINEMKPKAEYFDALVDKNLLTNLRDTAKELHIAPSKFNEFLLENEYIYKDNKGVIKPYQPRVKQGLFELKEYINPYSGHLGNQTMVTPRGRETFRLLLQNI